MSEIEDEDAAAGGSPVDNAVGGRAIHTSPACLSCGAAVAGVFCVACGQKHDDLRRSLFNLARDFVEDTFSFDSRMWRTLGSLVVAPGLVPNAYSHGKRSRYTPPVRLFLVVSFLFFLTLSLTQTYFVALQVTPIDEATTLFIQSNTDEIEAAADDEPSACGLTLGMRFLTRAADIPKPPPNWAACQAQLSSEADEALLAGQAISSFDRFAVESLSGIGAAVNDPAGFNAAFNNWLPRVLFLMTPIAALIMAFFIRGQDALYFDHLILSFYSHAIAFAVVGVALIATQFGAAFAGPIAMVVLFAYLLRSIKRAYGRGWIKTVWTALAGGTLYLIVLLGVMLSIVSTILLRAMA